MSRYKNKLEHGSNVLELTLQCCDQLRKILAILGWIYIHTCLFMERISSISTLWSRFLTEAAVISYEERCRKISRGANTCLLSYPLRLFFLAQPIDRFWKSVINMVLKLETIARKL